MAKASELVVGSVWYPLSGLVEKAFRSDVERALANPITITGAKGFYLALTTHRFGGKAPDRATDGWLCTAKESAWRIEMSPAVRAGTDPKRSAHDEPERIIPKTFILAGGRGLVTRAALDARLAELDRKDAAQKAASDAKKERVSGIRSALRDNPRLLPALCEAGCDVREADEWDEMVTVRIRTADAVRALADLLGVAAAR